MLNPVQPRRRQHHLHRELYTQPGAYFVTICARQKLPLFGRIGDRTMRLSPAGLIVDRCWKAIAEHWPMATLDLHVIMPNHIHGLIAYIPNNFPGRIYSAPTNDAPPKAAPTDEFSLPHIVSTFKAAVTRLVNRDLPTAAGSIWQDGYYDHIIRNEVDLQRIREYICNNVIAWSLDKENPNRTGLHPIYVYLDS